MERTVRRDAFKLRLNNYNVLKERLEPIISVQRAIEMVMTALVRQKDYNGCLLQYENMLPQKTSKRYMEKYGK